MSGGESTARKQQYFSKLSELLQKSTKILIVGADNVGSSQMQMIRKKLRGKATILMGKNTLMRKVIRGQLENNKNLESLLTYVKGNIGFVFCEELGTVKKIIEENKVAAPAKVGSIAPVDVKIPAGNTGLEPTQTSFLQALNIASKISKGQIEIISDVHLISAGQRVGASEANLLAKLNIKPFYYGLVIKSVWDNGSVYDPSILDMTEEDILQKFRNGIKNIAALGLQIGYPTIASLPHSLIRGYKNILAVALATDYSFPKADKFKEMLANPSAFATIPTTTTTTTTQAKTETKVEEKKEEPKEESDEDMGLGLFD
jgi:large subunit ribosomal protein LP0